MHAHVSLLGIAGLPLIAGVIALVFAPLWRRWFGEERATGLAGRFALGGTLLAVFLLAAAMYGLRVRPDLAPTQPVPWASVGFTTALGLDLAIDGLTLIVAGFAVIVALATQLAGLVEPRGAVTLGRAAVLLGATLLLGLASTVWAAAIGWQIAMLVVGSCGGEKAWARWTDAGVWLAVLAIAVGAGDLGLELVTRGALFGVQSPLVSRGMAALATVGLGVAVVGRVLGFAAALRGESTATRAALHGLASAAGALLLLRVHVVLALAPTVLAVLAVLGGGIAVAAGWSATRETERWLSLARVTQATCGLMLVAIAMGAWVPACGLMIVHGLALPGLVLGGRAARWIAGLTLGLAPIGAGLWIGEIAGAGFVYMSAWSPAINVVLAGLGVLAAAGLGGAMGHVLRDRSKNDEGEGAGLYAGLGVVLAVLAAVVVGMDVPGATDSLRVWLSPTFTASWLLQGDYAMGPRPPYSVELARWGAAVTVLAAWAGFVGLRGGATWRWPQFEFMAGLQRRWSAACRGLHAIFEGRLMWLMLRPGEVQAARAGGPPQATHALALLLAGTLALIGAVYCNADVAQLGPSRAYPVDVGGLDPALLGSRRPGEEAK